VQNSLPSIKSLQAFLVTAESLNFTHAAQELNLTQGAVSRQVQSLEEYMGAALFYRNARGLSLTPKGEALRPVLKEALANLHQVLSSVAASANKLNLNAPSCITPWLLPKLMAFQQTFPDIDVELTSTIKHQPEPSFEPFDAVIVYGKKPVSPSILSHLLFDEFLTPMCRPDILRESQQPFTETLSGYTWLHSNQEQSDWKLWLSHLKREEISSKHNQVFSTLDQAMNAAMQGFGLVIGDVTLAEQDLQMGRIIAPYKESVASGNSYYLLQPKSRQSDSLAQLTSWLLESAI